MIQFCPFYQTLKYIILLNSPYNLHKNNKLQKEIKPKIKKVIL
ncbi:hypothetical protein HPMG_01900 [Helicobacter pullorum MIT 98-5489]|uniref:Uncharacterized protein n=1 Tax=Helicobacter pullorum MIT 98-5489 TaxID=537972 RepID=C5F2E9_9HELI|nr:hypothetical protein HPMG_01900 [Helicobacter pullorum MIT 98-5489]